MEQELAAPGPPQRYTSLSPDQEANIITKDRPAGCRNNHQRNRKLVRLPRIDSGNQQHRFARERNPDTFSSHKDKDSPIPIGNQKILQIGCSYMEHMTHAFTLYHETA